MKAKTLKIFASGGSFLKEKKLTKSRYLNLKKEQNKGGVSKGFLEIPVIGFAPKKTHESKVFC